MRALQGPIRERCLLSGIANQIVARCLGRLITYSHFPVVLDSYEQVLRLMFAVCYRSQKWHLHTEGICRG